MIGFLFGCAAGLAVGCVLGALAAAIYEVKVQRIFGDKPTVELIPWPPSIKTATTARTAAGVRVCSCIGALRGPHFVDPECPFHGGAA